MSNGTSKVKTVALAVFLGLLLLASTGIVVVMFLDTLR